MNESNNSTRRNAIIAAAVIAVLIIAGIVAYSASRKDDDTTDNNNNTMTKDDSMKKDSVMVGGAAMYADRDIIDNVSNASNLTTLVSAVKAADLVDALKGDGPFTVFGPTNAAFDKLPAGTVDTVLMPENKAQLQAILKYHVVSGKYAVADLKDGQMLTTLQGDQLFVRKANGKTMINGAMIETPDVMQSNGVAHVIDTVLIPPAASKEVGGAAMLRTKTLAENAVNAPNLTTLVQAAQAAGLVETLADPNQQLTVFAPDNAAFAKLPAATLSSLLLPENKAQLQAILAYHVVPGVYSTAQLYDGQKLPTVNGQTLTVKKSGNQIQLVNSDGMVTSTITNSDVYQANGVAHVIDTVLLPASK